MTSLSPIHPESPGDQPPWWRPFARMEWRRQMQRYQRRMLRYERAVRHHDVFVFCINRGIPMPPTPTWWNDLDDGLTE